MNKYSLYDIVEKINGGGIVPVGKTNYDNEAFERMKSIKDLIEMLFDDMLRVYEQTGHEASVHKAKDEAERWFKEVHEAIGDILAEENNNA